MQEEPNPVKDFLFEYIEKSERKIHELITRKKFDVIINEVMKNCYDKVVSIGKKDETLGVLATGLLHYLLTNVLINSQRKVEYHGTELDIVIPDVKTLEKDPKRTLVICIPKSSDKITIEKKISQLEKIQPEKQNIWLVLSENIPLNNKTFEISKENSTFSKIIFEIAQFTNVTGANKFKILQV